MNKQDGESCNNCCCKGNSCGTGQRGSLGRILLGVVILSAIFFWGVKAGMHGGGYGMMHGGGYGMMHGREGKSGKGGRGCFGNNDDKGNYGKMRQGKIQNNNIVDVAPAVVEPAPVAEENAPTQEVIPAVEGTQ